MVAVTLFGSSTEDAMRLAFPQFCWHVSEKRSHHRGTKTLRNLLRSSPLRVAARLWCRLCN